MELTLGLPDEYQLMNHLLVSILVLVELTLGLPTPYCTVKNKKGFNPCFSGTYSRTEMTLELCCAILCFNPCFSGTYSRTSVVHRRNAGRDHQFQSLF